MRHCKSAMLNNLARAVGKPMFAAVMIFAKVRKCTCSFNSLNSLQSIRAAGRL
jgi:hypothetical protein